MENSISHAILDETVENTAQRCLLKSMGYTNFELKNRPYIGIANSFNTICPGQYNLRELADFVKKGVYAGGGTVAEFGFIGPCDGIVDGDPGMRYSLPSREVMCDSIEIQAKMAKFDAIVLLGSCDKIVPAMLMAAARMDIPAIVVNGGPMLGGIEFDGKKTDQTTTDEAIGMMTAGKVTAEQILEMEDLTCPTVGSCSFLGTANTMCCTAEALGMSLPGSALIPAVYGERRRAAFESGLAICDMVRDGLSARHIITNESMQNTIHTMLAICGSTNAVMHLSAIAHEANLSLDVMETFRKGYETVPQIVKVNPSGKADMEAFHRAGGLPRAMGHLGDLLDTDVMTCTGKSLAQNLSAHHFSYPEDTEIIRPLQNPFHPKGAIAILQGNLAPLTAVTKPGAFDESLYHFVGKAKVYDCEDDANAAILRGDIEDGNVVVIRYEGPKGGPGMPEMYKSMKFLYGQGKGATTALITDGRFSGTNNGCFVGHISPEAADGGPIAIVENGDEILIDVNEGKLELHVEEEVIKQRFKKWIRPEKKIDQGYLQFYSKAATSAAKGAIISCDSLRPVSSV